MQQVCLESQLPLVQRHPNRARAQHHSPQHQGIALFDEASHRVSSTHSGPQLTHTLVPVSIVPYSGNEEYQPRTVTATEIANITTKTTGKNMMSTS